VNRSLGPLEAAFASIFGYRAAATREPVEPGEFDEPDPETVERVRRELEDMRRRQNEHSPLSPFGKRPGVEL